MLNSFSDFRDTLIHDFCIFVSVLQGDQIFFLLLQKKSPKMKPNPFFVQLNAYSVKNEQMFGPLILFSKQLFE
jgi:hypothetical protein